MPNRATELVWDEKSASPEGGLNRAAIVRAAIAIADAEGLDAVSIRHVAAALDVRPMSLYTHVASKDDLLGLMVNEIVGDVLVPEPLPTDWREAMRAVAVQSYRGFVAHPWALEAFGRRPMSARTCCATPTSRRPRWRRSAFRPTMRGSCWESWTSSRSGTRCAE